MITAHNGLSHADLRGLKRDLVNLDRAHQSARGRLKYEIELLDAALDRVSPGAVDVTDHAVVRWLERVEGFDVAAVRQKIAAIVFANPGPGEERAIGFEGGTLIVQDGRTVVTVLDPGQRPKRSREASFHSPFAALAGLKFDDPKPAAPAAEPEGFFKRLWRVLSCARGAS